MFEFKIFVETLIPTSEEMQNDNPLTPVDAPELDERIEDEENDEIRGFILFRNGYEYCE